MVTSCQAQPYPLPPHPIVAYGSDSWLTGLNLPKVGCLLQGPTFIIGIIKVKGCLDSGLAGYPEQAGKAICHMHIWLSVPYGVRTYYTHFQELR